MARRAPWLWALGAFTLPTCLHAQAYKIAFVSQRKNDRGIFVMQSDGSGLKQLTDDPLAVLTDGAWSPDGQRLTFNAMRKGGMRLGVRGLAWNDNRDEEMLTKYPLPFHFPLYVMDANGEGSLWDEAGSSMRSFHPTAMRSSIDRMKKAKIRFMPSASTALVVAS